MNVNGTSVFLDEQERTKMLVSKTQTAMKADTSFIPVIDLFAGPGGLGEGFTSVTVDGKRPFRTVLPVECDPYAYETLLLRAFLRAFKYQGKSTPRQYSWPREMP